MQLTLYTDYSLRVLVYLSLFDDNSSTISEIADFYQISRNHLVKVVHNLSLKNYIHSTRGKGGGLRLARPATEIGVGAVIRDTEPNFHIVECFSKEPSSKICNIEPVCKLKSILGKAMDSFLNTLDDYTIADVVKDLPVTNSTSTSPIQNIVDLSKLSKN